MGRLSNPKHDNFAKLVAAGYPPADAAEHVGYQWNPSYANQLLRRPEIAARIVEWGGQLPEVKEKRIKENGPDREYVLTELLALLALSRRNNDMKSANAVVELLGKSIGMFGGRSTIKYVSGGASRPDLNVNLLIDNLKNLPSPG